MSAFDRALGIIADLVNMSDRGHPEAEQFLKAHGWEFVGRRFLPPDVVARLPVCKHCNEKYDEELDLGFCWANTKGHEAEASE